MLMDIKDVQRITFGLKLHAPEEYIDSLKNNPKEIEDVVNGVGSEEHWSYHLTPDTIYGMNINPCSHIHDYMYVYPKRFTTKKEALVWKEKADDWFEKNVKIMIEDCGGFWKYFRRARLWWYMIALRSEAGDIAFWKGKVEPNG